MLLGWKSLQAMACFSLKGLFLPGFLASGLYTSDFPATAARFLLPQCPRKQKLKLSERNPQTLDPIIQLYKNPTSGATNNSPSRAR